MTVVIEPMTCGYCDEVVEGCIWQWSLTHNCAGQVEAMSDEMKKAIQARVDRG